MQRRKTDTRTENFDKLKDTTQKLKAENRQLRKQLKTLQKELNRLIHREAENSLDFEEPSQVKKPPKKVPKQKCNDCNSEDIVIIPAGIFNIHKCNVCGFKKRHKKT